MTWEHEGILWEHKDDALIYSALLMRQLPSLWGHESIMCSNFPLLFYHVPINFFKWTHFCLLLILHEFHKKNKTPCGIHVIHTYQTIIFTSFIHHPPESLPAYKWHPDSKGQHHWYWYLYIHPKERELPAEE